ncbi:MAG TPA: hypothetical protein VD864_14555 [Nocardioides sp.]|nr:hypothetical protein [Nocardioides sp.]
MSAHPTARPASHARRPSAAARRSGYVGTVVVDALCLAAVNWWPGWDVVPFLTEETDRVVGWVNASIAVHLALFALYVAWSPRGLRAAGEVVTSAFGVVVTARVWQVYPFETADDWSGWGLVAHVLLALGVAGSAIGVVSGLVHLAQACLHPEVRPGPSRR